MTIREEIQTRTETALRHRAAVSARGLRRAYGEGESRVVALDDVSLEVLAGQFTVVMGPSGSGKSTLMHVLAGLDQADDGFVRIGDDELGSLSESELTRLRRERIAFVFQAFNLLPVLTARENVELPLRIAGRDDRGRAADLLRRFGLSDRADHLPAELSGGQQQRIAIARALVAEPEVLFADEPTGNLDSVSGRDVLAAMRESVELMGQTIVMVTHDPAAAAMGDRVVFLADGRIARDLDRPDETEILDVMAEVSR